jgi:cytochrome c biogenesis protein ResB
MVSLGMIVFHVCFLAMLGGVVYNSLFHFRAVLRLTEGETLPNDDPASYDSAEAGRFFDFSTLRGETTLVKMHRDYQVDGKNKRAAYEIAVGEGNQRATDTIYITQNLDRDGVRYLVSKEGYSLGIAVHDKKDVGRGELFAIMVPLQSLAQRGGGFVYTTGTSQGPDAFPIPLPPQEPLFWLQLEYLPKAEVERAGEVAWEVPPPGAGHVPLAPKRGKARIGLKFDAGDHLVEVREVRYWVGMTVRKDPGLTLILASLWAGLGGMTMTFIGRIRQDSKRASPRIGAEAGQGK